MSEDGEDGASLGVPLEYPQRYKVPLPLPSLREEISDALDPIQSLLGIPRHPFRHRKGKPLGSRLFRLASQLLPILHWARHYKTKFLIGDILAGLTIWSLVPQDVGYASLAGMPAVSGLLSSFLPPLVYAVLGTSRHLSVGPTPIIALLVRSLCTKFYDPIQERTMYMSFVATSTFFSGCFALFLGVFQLGFIADLLSHAAILAILAGAAILCIFIEFGNILGYVTPPERYSIVYLFQYLIFNGPEFNWRAFLIGISFFTFLIATKFLARKFQEHHIWGQVLLWLSILGPMISVGIATLCVYLTKPDVPTVAEIDGGLGHVSSVSSFLFTGPDLGWTIGVGVVIGLMSLSEAVAIGRTFASAKGYQIAANQEMFAIGSVNVVSSMTSGFAVAGSFARSALSVTTGAHTQLFTIISCIGVLITLLAAFRIFSDIPKAVLSAVIIDAVLGLIRVPGIIHIWKTDKLDFLVFLATLITILFTAIEYGMIVAVVSALLKLIVPISRPSIAILGNVRGSGLFRPVSQYASAEEVEGTLVLLINGPIIFANADYVRERILEIVETRNASAAICVQLLALDFTPVSDTDTTGIHALFELLRSLQSTQLAICNPSRPVLRKLVASGFLDALGTDKLYFSVVEAVQIGAYMQQQTNISSRSLSQTDNQSSPHVEHTRSD